MVGGIDVNKEEKIKKKMEKDQGKKKKNKDMEEEWMNEKKIKSEMKINCDNSYKRGKLKRKIKNR